jgi:hypothetical protein
MTDGTNFLFHATLAAAPGQRDRFYAGAGPPVGPIDGAQDQDGD